MRIAFVTATYPPYQGGTGNVCFYNAREIANRGHDVHVFTAAAPGAAQEEIVGNCHVHRLDALLRIGNAPLLPRLFTELKEFDLIHLHFPFMMGAEIVRAASAVRRIPLVVSFHNDLLGNGPRAPLMALYQRVSALVSVRGTSQLCVVSRDHYASSELARTLASSRHEVVELPNGVDTDMFTPLGSSVDRHQQFGIPSASQVVLFVAALDRAHHFKGLDRMLVALKEMPEHIWLLVVGDGDLRTEYERQAVQLGIAHRTVFAGAIDHEELPPVYRCADVTVLPSTPPESFGLVLVESLACGTPVVASRIPGVRTVVNHGVDGFLLDAANPGELSDTIMHILGDELNRREMGERGRRKVEQRYAWDKVGTRLEAIYERVLAGPQGRLTTPSPNVR